MRVWWALVALVGIAALLAIAGSAQAQLSASVSFSPSSVDQVKGLAAGTSVVVRVTNVGSTAESTSVTLSGGSGILSFAQPAAQSIPAGGTLDFVGTATANQGGPSSGAIGLTVTASVSGTNATGSSHSASVSGSFTLHRRTGFQATVAPSTWAAFGAGQSQTFDVRASDPYNGWDPTYVYSVSSPSCSPSVGWMGPVFRDAYTVASSEGVRVAYVTFTAPPNLVPTALGPTGVPWRETTIDCTATLTHDAPGIPSATVTFRLTPFFGGSAPAEVVGYVQRGSQAQVEIPVEYLNRHATPVMLTVTPSTGLAGIAFTQSAYTVTVQPGARATLRIVAVVPDGAPEAQGPVSLVASVVGGSTFVEGTSFAPTLRVVRPVEVQLATAPPATWPKVVPGSSAEIPLLAGERHGWKDVALTSAQVACPPDMASWEKRVVLDKPTVPRGSALAGAARLVLAAPASLDAREWRGQTRVCRVDVVSNGHGGGSSGTTSVDLTIDPALPAAIGLEPQGAPPAFRFDATRVGATPTFVQPYAMGLRNWGEEAYAGPLSFDVGGRCAAQWRALADVALPASPASATPPVATTPGELVVDARQPEGACANATVAPSGKLLGVPQTLPPFTIRHGAALDVEPTLDFGEVPIGDNRTLVIRVAERLGYVPVPVALRVEGEGDPGDLAPIVEPQVVVRAGQAQGVAVTFNPRAGAAACELRWTLRWEPLEDRPALAPATTTVTAKTTIVGIEEVIQGLPQLQLADDEIERMLRDFRDRGCSIPGQEQRELYANVYDAASRLEAALAAPASSDVVADAANVAAVAERLDTYAGTAPVFGKLQPANDRLRARVLAQVEASIQGEPAAHQLLTAQVACELVEGDCAPIRARYEAALQAETEAADRANEALAQLFDFHVDAGVEIVDGFPVRANPWGWIELWRSERALEAQTQEALSAFAGIAPIEERVHLAHDEAAHSLASLRRGLLAGAVVDGLVLLALAGAGALVWRRYAGDRAELSLARRYSGERR